MSGEIIHNELNRSLGRMEGKVDGIAEDVTEIKSLLQIQNGRLRKLETWKTQLTSSNLLIGAGGGSIGGFIILVVLKKFGLA